MTDDLDELVSRCESEHGGRFFAEAVAAYEAGALRSSIIMTWIAVVFDIIEKLGDFAESGRADAQQLLEHIEHVRASNDVRGSQEFESTILEKAQAQYGFMTPIQRQHLEELRRERHLCAHPTLQSLEEPYNPSKARARSFLVGAVEDLLAQPAIRISVAVEEVIADIDWNYFPTTSGHALERLKAGPMQKANPQLVRRVILRLLRGWLREGRTPRTERSYSAALIAIRTLYPEVFQQTLQADLPTIAAGVRDDALVAEVRLVASVPEALEHLGSPNALSLRKFVEHAPDVISIEVIEAAVDVPQFEQPIRRALARFDMDRLQKALASRVKALALDEAASRYAKSPHYKDANILGEKVIVRFAADFDTSHVDTILTAFLENRQVGNSTWGPIVVKKLADVEASRARPIPEGWRRFFEQLRELPGTEKRADVISHLNQQFPGLSNES
jgi:hypothetical protein